MLGLLRHFIPERSPLRIQYHKISAVLAAVCFGFPAKKLKVIGVTGTSGKSTTCELIYFLLFESGQKVGMISGVQFHFPSGTELNESLRTTLRSWTTQKYLRRMVREGCDTAIVEISSHAIDQHRLWGVPLEVAVLTNIGTGEHMDYHGTFADYVRTKALMFPGAPYTVLPHDDEYYDFFKKYISGEITDFSRINPKALVSSSEVHLASGKTSFHLRVKNKEIPVTVALTGEHNVENVLTAVAVVQKFDISPESCAQILSRFTGLPGRLESIQEGQKFPVLVDHTYKPPALRAVLETLKKITRGKLIVVWGGTGHRLSQFWSDSGAALHKFADEIILTTDDPYNDDPRVIASYVKKEIPRKEGEHFFEITDRYEAIRYALLTAESEDTVLIAGRGCEQTQTIGKLVIPFDDREVCREILRQGRGIENRG